MNCLTRRNEICTRTVLYATNFLRANFAAQEEWKQMCSFVYTSIVSTYTGSHTCSILINRVVAYLHIRFLATTACVCLCVRVCVRRRACACVHAFEFLEVNKCEHIFYSTARYSTGMLAAKANSLSDTVADRFPLSTIRFAFAFGSFSLGQNDHAYANATDICEGCDIEQWIKTNMNLISWLARQFIQLAFWHSERSYNYKDLISK